MTPERPSTAGVAGAYPPGALTPLLTASRPAGLAAIPYNDLMAELLARLYTGTVIQGEDGILLGDALAEALGTTLDVHGNRFSTRRLFDQFHLFHHRVAGPRPPIKGARYVDLGCGSHNPLGLLFLFQLLGASHGTGVDLDRVLDQHRAVRAMARIARTLLEDPKLIVGDLPVSRLEIEANLAGVNLEMLRAGDARGLDWNRLAYKNENVYSTSLPEGGADVVLSNSFLEHLEDLDRLMVELWRITAPGGFGIHNIDGIDHRSYADSSLHPLAFLREPGTAYLHQSNRVRPQQFLERFERHGFVVQQFVPVRTVAVPPEVQAGFASPWRELPRDVLETAIGAVVVRKDVR